LAGREINCPVYFQLSLMKLALAGEPLPFSIIADISDSLMTAAQLRFLSNAEDCK